MQNMPNMPRKTKIEKARFDKRLILQVTNEVLGVIFYLVWIFVGLFFILFIVANFRQGAFSNLFGSQPQSQSQPDVQAPTETTLPGIGKVNIACVQEALSQEGIQKILTEQSTDSLTDEEKAKFEPCIVEKETASPSPNQ